MTQRSWKLLDILNETSGFFLGKGLENPRLQAELLLADVLTLRRVDLYLEFERVLTEAEVDAYRDHVRQRSQRRPLQYIVGSVGFREIDLAVREGVLIPRPETEILVGVVLELVRELESPRVADLGCGSGAIAVAVAAEHGGAQLTAVDIEPAAVELAAANALALGVAERVTVLQGDLFAPLDPAAPGFDVVASNPPYVRRDEISTLQPEVRDYEPRLALDGGIDGLDMYRLIIGSAPIYLAAAGHLVLELGQSQGPDVSQLVDAQPELELTDIRSDLSGIPRVLVARKSGG
jgi:release factor glutamine methyltransferase